MNYFVLFGLPNEYAIDLENLSLIFYQKQREVHPDLHSEVLLNLSVQFNQAYSVLQDPIKRALHLLEIQGFPIEKSEQDSDMLFYFMDQHESLKLFIEKKDFLSIKKQSQNLHHLNENTKRKMDSALQKKKWQEGLQFLQKIQMLQRILKEVDSVLSASLKK